MQACKVVTNHVTNHVRHQGQQQVDEEHAPLGQVRQVSNMREYV